ncbi:peptidoglycan-binding protein [Kitasatospora sp. MBT66]|uniref:peptidoglycan-binding domain-containing protein n=1 Tax=Kitasatospora sp. MBT66 TaxID=1444769 RepID=UPI00068FD95F|nr:peptidoglycan-binding domain-containing protein [Kitasatospora sp. MBT66]
MKRTLATLCATAAAVVGLISTAPAAAAADGNCSTTKLVNLSEGEPGLWFELPATSGGSISCIMRRGAVGNHVKALQKALSRCHSLDTGGTDGVYGAKTEAAVRTVQSWYDELEDDGVYGPNTRDSIRWISWGDTRCV